MESTQNDEENRVEKADADDSPSSRDLGVALDTIGQQMGHMASILQKIYAQQQTSERPTGRKRARSASPPATSSTTAKSYKGAHQEADEAEGSSRQFAEDAVSLHASDSEQPDLEEDILRLTEQNPQVNDQPDLEILRDLANELEEDEPTGQSIKPELADVANKRWAKRLGPEKLKALFEKYKRPENCGAITEVRVNPEIWAQLAPPKRKADLQLANIQQIVRKLLFANLQLTNSLMGTVQQVDTKLVLAQAIDSVALLGHVNHNLSQQRRDHIRPALRAEYVSICSSSTDTSDSKYLFGDDLPKRLREAKESCRIGSTVAHSFVRHNDRRQYQHDNQSNSQRFPNNRPPYRKPGRGFYRGQSRPFKRKSGPQTERK